MSHTASIADLFEGRSSSLSLSSSSNKDGILSRKYSIAFIIISLVAVILAIVFVITNI